eukprot:6916069-Pyramimonas_sp.AAC.1
MVDGVPCVTTDRLDKKFIKHICKSNTSMLDELTRLRNAAADAAMRRVMDADPLAEAPAGDNVDGPDPKRPRRELLDEIPSTIQIEVPTAEDATVSVNVLPTIRHNARLAIEMTGMNMQLLSAKPFVFDEYGDSWVPEVRSALVTWVDYRDSCRVQYYDKASGKTKLKSMK